MSKIFIYLAISPLIYFLIALSLVFFPVEQRPRQKGLDFEVLAQDNFSTTDIKEDYYVARDKNKLFYRHIEGTPYLTVVLLHGSGTEGRYLLPLANRLNSSLGVTVIIPDLRGHGRSIVFAPGDISYLGQFEHDLEDLYQHIKLLNPNSKVILGGHSSGGGLAVKYGGNRLSKFDGFILLAPYLGYQAPTVRPDSGGWVQVARLRYAGLAMLNNVGFTFLNNLPVLYFNRPSEISDDFQIDSYSYRLNESFYPTSYTADLTGNTQSILLLVGELDEAFYPEVFRDVLQDHAPHAEFHIVSGIKHLNLPSSDVAIKLIVNWLQTSY